MRLLLDTNAVETLRLIEDPGNEVFVSIVGLWEIALKVSVGKLELTEPYHALIPREMKRNSIELIPSKIEHFAMVLELPFHRRDPFDRLLAAQAIIENFPVVSSDSMPDAYGVSRVW